MKQFLIGLLVGWLLVPVILFAYLRFGYAPVATSAPLFPFEELLASTAVQARISREAPAAAAIPATEPNLLAGAKLYRQQCAQCHGLAGQPESAASQGMFPRPPQFFERPRLGTDPVGPNYWVIANGIRLTGMPAYRRSLSEEQLWQVSQFISNVGHLPGPVSDYLQGN